MADLLPEFDEQELARQALAADPDTPVPDDAVPFEGMEQQGGYGLLPGWYMPAVRAGGVVKGWRRVAAVAVIIALVSLVAFGLCSTDGYVSLA